MVNRERGEALLVTPTQRYTLRLIVEACCALEVQAGASLDDLTVAVNRGRISALRWILWAALQAEHASVVTTADQAGAILDAAGGPRVMRGVLADFLKINADDDPPKTKKGQAAEDDRPGSLWRRLYLDAREMGMPGAVFWQLSLRELWLELAAGRQARKTQRDRLITQSWWTAALAGSVFAGKLPALDTLLGSPKKRQTPMEQRAVMEALSASLGRPLIRIQLSAKGSKAS